MLTPGQVHDLTCAEPLLEGVDPEALIADKAYDADPLRDTLAQRDIDSVIPPKANRKAPPPCDFVLYCERNLIERFFNKLKHFRAIATRYDKLSRNGKRLERGAFLQPKRLIGAELFILDSCFERSDLAWPLAPQKTLLGRTHKQSGETLGADSPLCPQQRRESRHSRTAASGHKPTSRAN